MHSASRLTVAERINQWMYPRLSNRAVEKYLPKKQQPEVPKVKVIITLKTLVLSKYTKKNSFIY